MALTVALKAAVEQVRQEYAFSQRRACGLMLLAVSSYRYQTKRSDEPLRSKLVELAREKLRFGYRRLQAAHYQIPGQIKCAILQIPTDRM